VIRLAPHGEGVRAPKSAAQDFFRDIRMRRFHIEPLGGPVSHVRLSAEDSRHLVQVLRLGIGAPVRLFDGMGMEYEGRVTSIDRGTVAVAVEATRRSRCESPLEMILLQGFLKEKKMDLLVRQATELGVSRFVPVFARRSVPRPEAGRLESRFERWEKIATEALKQCRRGRVPAIGPACGTEDALALVKHCVLKIVFWEEGGRHLNEILADIQRPAESVALLMGPEGGLGADEIAAAREAGFEVASLGPRILRAETATVAACALLQHRLGDL
jgi:16S rRNA (uracil1498-N3)-methyltransferase